MTDGDITPDKLPNLRRVSTLALSRQAVSEPINLAGDVIKDLCKS
jgi:hypothetical protein